METTEKLNIDNYKVFDTEIIEFMRGTNRRRRLLYLSILINCNDTFESIHFLTFYWLGIVANPTTLYGNAHSEQKHILSTFLLSI